ncbi:hypothetical protein IWT30_00264 [Secundilactobacillus mixtipabuli]|uniref:Uncharacterized protein n=1 Tax=Secundilactobacillus mixtipabuli TaxID=1435342 RepID=A0A1Z5I9U7_9LACO|nr:hypothetical protein IWT30_00264 [Secundilactobacillus mixtipabuli]
MFITLVATDDKSLRIAEIANALVLIEKLWKRFMMEQLKVSQFQCY